MSQIPAFLKSLSALVRQLVSEKRAVHVTAKTADELDLLAGLPWRQSVVCACEPDSEPDEPGDARTHYRRTCTRCGKQWEGLHCPHEEVQNVCPGCAFKPVPVRGATPADIAFGWLRLSRVTPDYEASGGAPYEEGLHEVSGERILRAAECAELAVLSWHWWALQESHAAMEQMRQITEEAPLRRIDEVVAARPHDGTIEGARACWHFIRGEIDTDEVTPGMSHRHKQQIYDTYQRELWAMR